MSYSQSFISAVGKTLQHEGGYVNHPSDPGGETNFGISKRTYPNLNIRKLTKEKAIEIYYSDFWLSIYDSFNSPRVAGKIFDISVNMGTKRAHRAAQRACLANTVGVVEDGFLGPRSLSAINAIDEVCFMVAYRAEVAGIYRQLILKNPKFSTFKTGWLKRAYE